MRLAALAWIREPEPFNGGVFAGTGINQGFLFQGERITLKGPTGIWFPKGFGMPLSLSTALNGPYRLDDPGDDGLLTYAHRGDNPRHRDNGGLREAFRTRTPLVYFKETRDHRCQAIWPVIIILEDHPESLCVTASLDPACADLKPGSDFSDIAVSPLDLRRYAWAQTRQRLPQGAFRDMVIAAYDRRCAICGLNHPEFLDAARSIPDSDDRGAPEVPSGRSLCKIQHAAYDQNILGIDPDCRVRIRQDILEERDGPMLRHGLQELDGQGLILPARAVAVRPPFR